MRQNGAANPASFGLIRGLSVRQIRAVVPNWLEAIKRRKRRMKTKPGSKADPIERQIESAFRPGTFIRDGSRVMGEMLIEDSKTARSGLARRKWQETNRRNGRTHQPG